MTVIDASVLVDALVTTGPAGDAARVELVGQRELSAPTIFRAEATSALRGLLVRRELSSSGAQSALDAVRSTQVTTYPFEPFIDRVWELRDNLTVYDAWYVAVAETLGVALVTGDARLQRAPGVRCEVLAPGSRGAL